MKRDMEKIAEEMKNKIPESYLLSLPEYKYLANKARGKEPDAAYDAVAMAFRYGFALGQRHEKRQAQQKKKITGRLRIKGEPERK